MSIKESYLNILNTIDRPGKDKLIEYLEKSTFFTDPASCNEHNAYEGGLAEHSLNVYNILDRNCTLIPEMDKFKESIKIVGLLHDICHTGTFQKVSKNVNVRGKDDKNKLKEDGRLVFIEKESYDPLPEAQLPYQRGTLSTMLIKQHMNINKLEDLAIQWHVGEYDLRENNWGILK